MDQTIDLSAWILRGKQADSLKRTIETKHEFCRTDGFDSDKTLSTTFRSLVVCSATFRPHARSTEHDGIQSRLDCPNITSQCTQ
mmetsp:Transcript_49729/g.74130  ORF Transcript_49729/g.74130 Transcript_49729/m.74130 type:complete len:84 (+) Transcript_49729:46-297(+)